MFLLDEILAIPSTQVEPAVVGHPKVTIIMVKVWPVNEMLYTPVIVGVNTYNAS